MDPFHGTSFWITPEDGVQSCGPAGRVMLFRRRFQGKGQLIAAVSADSEYRLFCNGKEVSQGPAIGDYEETFYDSCDLTPYLQAENNELLAEVVGFSTAFPDFNRGGVPMARMALRDAFIFDGILLREDGSQEKLSTDDKWEAAAAPDISLFRCPEIPCAGPGEKYIAGVRQNAVFSPAQVIEPGFRPDNVRNTMLHYILTPKRIPDLQRTVICFRGCFDVKGVSGSQVRELLTGKSLEIAAGKTAEFVLDMEEECTARLLLSVERGTGKMDFFYTENLLDDKERHFTPSRNHAQIEGPMHDKVELSGASFTWKSFFYRAFRFVRVVIAADKEAIKFLLSSAEQENYPYDWKGNFVSGSEAEKRMWEMSQRTLLLCSHHIYEDCPCYERLQYTADSRITAQLAQILSGDTRLTEQAIRHFRHSLCDEGLTAGSYPSRSPVVLPLWSLHYVMMVEEYYHYSGKKALLKENLFSIRRILEWFLRYRQPEGGIGRLPHWNMADFSDQWQWNGEAPNISEQPSAYVTFFVVECLQSYAKMAEILSSGEEKEWAEQNCVILRKDCTIFYDKQKQLYADNPDSNSFSLLSNAQAVLAGITNDPGLLRRAYEDSAVKKPALFGNCFVFKAFLLGQDPEYAKKVLRQWEFLLIDGRTVFPEGTPIPRSECHGWSALPGFGLTLLYTGFRIETPGAKVISFAPYDCEHNPVKGSIPLPCGMVEFDFNGNFRRVKLPEDIMLREADGSKRNGTGDWMELAAESAEIGA